ncbi:MAG TPA: type VI secretion system tube protein Hcp [Bryobacteraceae bacterium]|nr:type VI secretion system tube protein Hcp [Bryobacteraceae bacterium]HPT25090.1 type VI secretion system tube protein Hcp [Bryobacteraceae bacterium]
MAMDSYLKIEGIPGEAKQKGYEGWIHLDGWQWGSSTAGQAERGGGLIGGKVQMQDFHITKLTDKATPKLFEACCKGQVFGEMKVNVVRMPGNQVVMDFNFKQCMVTSYQTGGGSGDAGVPIENVSLNFQKVNLHMTAMKEDGTVEGMVQAGWDIKTMMKI